MVVQPQFFREHVGEDFLAGIQALTDGAMHCILADPRSQRINWHNAPGDLSDAVFFKQRIYHLAAQQGSLCFAIKYIGFSDD